MSKRIEQVKKNWQISEKGKGLSDDPMIKFRKLITTQTTKKCWPFAIP